MINFIKSIVGLFLAPLVSWAASILGGPPGKLCFYYQGVNIQCVAGEKEFVESAIDGVVKFYGDSWPHYKGLVKRIILNEGIDTIVLRQYRTVIIKISDINRMRSIRSFTSQLVADYELLSTYKKNWSVILIWGSKVVDRAEKAANTARQKYLGYTPKNGFIQTD